MCEFADVFSSSPGLTNLVEHKIVMERDKPVRCKAYPVPFALQQVVDKETEQMIQMGVTEPSLFFTVIDSEKERRYFSSCH